MAAPGVSLPDPVEVVAAYVPWATAAVSGQFNFSRVYRLRLAANSYVDVVQEELTLAEGEPYVAFTVSAVVGAITDTQVQVYEALAGGGGEPVTVGPFLPEEPDLGALHVFNRNYPPAPNEDVTHTDSEDPDLPFPEVYAEDGVTPIDERITIIRGDWFKYTDQLDPLLPGADPRLLSAVLEQPEGVERWVRQARGRAQLIGREYTLDVPEFSGLVGTEVDPYGVGHPTPVRRHVNLVLRQSGVEFPIEISLRALDVQPNWTTDNPADPSHIRERPVIRVDRADVDDAGEVIHQILSFVHLGDNELQAIEDLLADRTPVEARGIFNLSFGYPFKLIEDLDTLQVPPRILEPDDMALVDDDNSLAPTGVSHTRYTDGHGMLDVDIIPIPLLSRIGGREVFVLSTEPLALAYNMLEDKVTMLENLVTALEQRVP